MIRPTSNQIPSILLSKEKINTFIPTKKNSNIRKSSSIGAIKKNNHRGIKSKQIDIEGWVEIDINKQISLKRII